MRALVTGGAGFIGSHICQELLSRGHQVVAVDNLANGRLENFDEFEDSKNFEFQKIDILDRDRLAPLFKGVDWVFHMAGLADIVPSIERPDLYFDVNVKGTLNVCCVLLQLWNPRILPNSGNGSHRAAVSLCTDQVSWRGAGVALVANLQLACCFFETV